MAKSGLAVTERDDCCVVDFAGETVLDPKAVEPVTDDLYDLVDNQKHARLLLDLSAVHFLSSPMIGTLVALHKKATDHGGMMVMCGLSANLYRVFQVSRLTNVLHFAPSVEAGEQVLHAPPGAEAELPEPIDIPEPSRWAKIVAKQLRIFFAGALVITPLAITVWVVWALGTWLDTTVIGFFYDTANPQSPKTLYGLGVVIIVALIYFVGLMTHFWLFRSAFGLVERLLIRLPGIKTIYESVRDLMKLFGGDSQKMGRVVQYNVPGTDMALLGILTNENPFGLPLESPHRKVSIYVPYSYMFGGPTFFASPDQVIEVDMSVEQCMKIAATAMVGAQPILKQPRKTAD